MRDAGTDKPGGALAGIVEAFFSARLVVILVVASLALGGAAVWMTPREEEPQIVVPMADVMVSFPGASAEEVEHLVATPLEKLLWQIDGVEHVYSMSSRNRAVVTVRFHVGEDEDGSMVELHHRIAAHQDEAPSGVRGWVIKPRAIDDVPIVTITLHSESHDDHALRRVGEEVLARLARIPNVSRTHMVGGRPRELRVELDPERMRSRGIGPLVVHGALRAADAALPSGAFDRADRRVAVSSGPFITDAADVGELVVGVHRGRPVHLADVATIRDGPAEASAYHRIGSPEWRDTRHAVTLAVAKQKGTNAVTVARTVRARMAELAATVLPSGVDYTVTRDNGRTANAKVNELLNSLAFAMLTVVVLLVFTLGWREGLIVALTVPITFALALFFNYVAGYTINRVTLFALILTLGLVVDNPITNVDNIQRHIRERRRGPYLATLHAVHEVLPPVLMSTLAIIISFLPMFYITGMMGPYMEPMAINVPLTMVMSTVAALAIVPWTAYRLLRGRAERGPFAPADRPPPAGRLQRIYRAAMRPFLASAWARRGLIAGIVVLLAACGLLVVGRQVPMKMLPFDNKDELQLVIDLPEGSTLERTDAVVRDFERYLYTVPEVTDFESYVGAPSPMDFNGLVRHYYFRRAPNLADVRVNLLPKRRRVQQSHAIHLRLRRDLEAIAEHHGAHLAIVESPPGPPVLATLVAEVYGPPGTAHAELVAAAERVAGRLDAEPGVRDVDAIVEAPSERLDFALDKEKAALHGIATDQAVRAQALALSGTVPATVHVGSERQPLPVRLRLSREARSGADELGRIAVCGTGGLVELAEIGRFERRPEDRTIYHKNLVRVVYVTAELVGRPPAEAVLDLAAHFDAEPLPPGFRIAWDGEGEWDITLRVFRDLGLAFGAALLGIYILLVLETGSFFMPLVVMSSIPLTAIGIIPGFWLLNLGFADAVGGFPSPIFFTATAMIGMIALGGIVVRNSIVLIEFIQGRLAEGADLREAIVASGAVRMRPILLTAGTTALGAWPITLDPIFSGLAWALIFGLVASTAFTLVVVPVLYYMVYRGRVPADAADAVAPG